MAISAIGQSSVSSTSQGSPKPEVATGSSSRPKSDYATISQAAKELAAKKTGTTSQEEATESVSEKLSEQVSGSES